MDNAIVIYRPDDLDIEVEYKIDSSNRIWGTQRQIAETLKLSVKTVSEHIQNFKRQRGGRADSHIRQSRITASDSKTYDVEHYDMTVITYIGFRANASERVMAFQDWAGKIIDDHIVNSQPSVLSPAQALLAAVQQIVDHEQRIEQLEAITQSNVEYYTVVGYYNLRKLGSLTKYEAQTIGRRAAKLSREQGVEIKDIPNSEHGTVHAYHISILDEIVVH